MWISCGICIDFGGLGEREEGGFCGDLVETSYGLCDDYAEILWRLCDDFAETLGELREDFGGILDLWGLC